jgi:hypothetical protein
LLGQVPAKFHDNNNLIPKFAVGVNDIPKLEGNTKLGYIACTPDSIFKYKSTLYDLLVTDTSFKSNNIPVRHNQADVLRYRILHPSNEINYPKDVFTTLSATLTGLYYWLYEDQPSTATTPSTWENLFAGSNHRREDSIQEHDLLLLNGNEDATEINNNQVYQAVVARSSTEIQGDKNRYLIK